MSAVAEAVEVRMPRLSDSMEEGVLVSWSIAAGEQVSAGVDIAEIETDKAVMPFEAEGDGVLHPLVEAGDTVAVGDLIAYLLPPGAEPPTSGKAEASDDGEPAASTDAATPTPALARVADLPTDSPDAEPAASSGGRANASPVARRIAADLGVDLAALEGSGPRGRIVKADVQRAADRAPEPSHRAADETPPASAAGATPTSPPSEDPPSTAKGEVTVVEPSRLQKTIARRMAEAKATAPEFTLEAEVDMTRAVAERARLKALLEGAPAPSLNDFVVKAVALTLRDHPKVNGAWRRDRFELYEKVNVGVAVAAPDALVVPVIRDADTRSLGSIATEVRRLAGAARDSTLAAADMDGGTFSVSNLGMFGIDRFTAVLNPPQAAILALGAVAERPVVRDGELTVASTMSVTLTCDHRIVHGADGAAFLSQLRDRLERPELLVL